LYDISSRLSELINQNILVSAWLRDDLLGCIELGELILTKTFWLIVRSGACVISGLRLAVNVSKGFFGGDRISGFGVAAEILG
jgi:hypothetical protein